MAKKKVKKVTKKTPEGMHKMPSGMMMSDKEVEKHQGEKIAIALSQTGKSKFKKNKTSHYKMS